MAGAGFSHFNANEGIEEAMPSIIILFLGIVAFISKRIIISKEHSN